jgi:hypothetical protein
MCAGHVTLALASTAFLAASQPLRAQGELPAIVHRGLQALASGRSDSAFISWANSPAFGPEEREQIVSAIPVFNQTCGAPSGYELLRSVALGTHIQRVYIVVRCEVRPVYLMLTTYHTRSAWSVTALNWSTDPDRGSPILPVRGSTPVKLEVCS